MTRFSATPFVAAAAAAAVLGLWTGCSSAPLAPNESAAIGLPEASPPSTGPQRPVIGRTEAQVEPAAPASLTPISGVAVPAYRRGIGAVVSFPDDVPPGLYVADPPKPGRVGPRPLGEDGPSASALVVPQPDLALGSSDANFAFCSTTFDNNATYNAGSLFIPPDNSMAAGPDHIVTVVNAVIQMHDKATGTSVFIDDLEDFFAPVSPVNSTFDPKVVYDVFEDRWVVVTLEFECSNASCTEAENAGNTSRILLAVSDTSDPTGSWNFTAIDSKENFSSFDYWADYPGFALDEEAVYVTVNLFTFSTGTFGGSRIYIVEKGTSGGFYDGGAAAFDSYDPFSEPPFAMTHQPALIHPDVPSGSFGTYFTGYGALSDGTDEYLQVLWVTDPLGTPTFSGDFFNIGNIEGPTFPPLPGAPQSGSAEVIATNDRRTYNSVYNDGKLYVTTQYLASGQVSALLGILDASTPTAPVVESVLGFGGEDIATGTFTSFPSIEVNPLGHAVLGYSASDDSIFPGAYFSTRDNAGGSFSASMVLQEGTDYYVRKFTGSVNRWGDYSGTAVDPVDGCVWVFNQYAMSRGTITNTTQDGRWATTVGKVCPNGWVFGDDFGDGFDRWTAVVGAP